MSAWRTLTSERRTLFAAVGLRLVDTLTQGPPLGRTTPALDLQAAGGSWQPAPAAVRLTSGGLLTVPSLGRTARPSVAAVQRYRIRLAADLYHPLYRLDRDGVEFDAYPYNDESPPAVHATGAAVLELVPASAYPFPAHMRVLRGTVVDVAGDPVADTEVTQGTVDRATTGARGEFALPLRVALDGVPVAVDAAHPRTGRTGSIQVTLPGDLGQSWTIQVS